jgi:acyl dehydratase
VSGRRIAFDDLPRLVGQELGASDWIGVDQARIDAFAAATGDHQWIHVDAPRAARGPYGTTVAHGYLTLSLVPALAAAAFEIEGSRMGVNYGLNRVRFPAPVPAGSRLRARFALAACEAVEGGLQLTMDATIEREGGDRPVCVAQLVARRYR